MKLLPFCRDFVQKTGDLFQSQSIPGVQDFDFFIPILLIDSSLCCEGRDTLEAPFFKWYPLLDFIPPGHQVFLPTLLGFLPTGPCLSGLGRRSI